MNRAFLRGRIYQLLQDGRPRTADDMARELECCRTKAAKNAGMLVSAGMIVSQRIANNAPRIYEVEP